MSWETFIDFLTSPAIGKQRIVRCSSCEGLMIPHANLNYNRSKQANQLIWKCQTCGRQVEEIQHHAKADEYK